MTRKFGFDQLAEQAGDYVAAFVAGDVAFQYQSQPGKSESPIERLLEAAVFVRDWFHAGCMSGFKLRYVSSEEQLREWMSASDGMHYLYMQQQVEMPAIGRVDFLFHVWGFWARDPKGGIPGWRKLIVECDGHDFHERTKDQAARDRSRDRSATLSGIELLRFTGSELWRDPWGCAGEIIEWADRGG